MEILDCTLRDGGYYTNWDFSKEIVDSYIDAVNQLPIDIIEIGYRSPVKQDYLGEYFYCPQYVIDYITEKCRKQVAIMFNEKDVRPEMLDDLLKGCDAISLVRLAVDPDNLERAIVLAKAIRQRGFEVALNIMYMSKWNEKQGFLDLMSQVDDVATYVNMVDSYGGVYPDEVKKIYRDLRSRTSVKVGFHGHNNLELGLINSLTAIECGADIIDVTITGMGRGAGNAKTELLLTTLNSKKGLPVDFNVLGKVVNEFEKMMEHYKWGTNLPYMIAGANSFPQKDVMEWVSNRFYSYNSIIRTLQNRKDGRKDNFQLPKLTSNKFVDEVVIVGGGPSAIMHASGITNFLSTRKKCAIIHASSKNAKPYKNLDNEQFFCLVGNEGHRLEDAFDDLGEFKGKCILPPYPRKMGTYIPERIIDKCFELREMTFTKSLVDTHTAIAIQTAIDLKASRIYLVGYDGYYDNVSMVERELSAENEELFRKATKTISICSLFPTAYDVDVKSLYSLLIHE
ncbi:MAG: hypothetical protein HC819_18470 [Cyclobacteriaceae bacterium]|nr:hypothetical protein [Cyclobacteriaceae bacterium]